MSPTSQDANPGNVGRVPVRAAFTLPEMLVVVGIIASLAVLSTLAWRAATAQSVRSLAVNTLTGFLGVARAYALSNQVETMLVVNPYDGRLELWRANAPHGQQRNPPWGAAFVLGHPDDVDGIINTGTQFPDGGDWDIASSGSVAAGVSLDQRSRANGYAFVPIMDGSARLPVDGNGVPRVIVMPIDFVPRRNFNLGAPVNPRLRLDNLIWTAFCFDPAGHLVMRARRIDMNHRGAPFTRSDYQPQTGLMTYSLDADPNPPGGRYDTLVLSTPGFIVNEAEPMLNALGLPYRDLIEPASGDIQNRVDALVEDWLTLTLPTQRYEKFAEHTLLSQWSGRPLQTAGKSVD